jgi:hypothetical protein
MWTKNETRDPIHALLQSVNERAVARPASLTLCPSL